MSEILILDCIYALLAYRDVMSDEGLKHPYILGSALIQPKINTEGIICILSLGLTIKLLSYSV